ncbi:DUF6850 family outer membrane beta-barrel protein [Pedobacter deserti]|uniref:DUF6850 family outer membrane beta-barrel protein n=1 Tax=Pedobacter deserti TaxID=2817382 RepID=UPI00210C9E96|nr:DUF6850 family outer membrane beta-barrel protein [Pedobacter sp. SYSU D00382]
MKIINTFRCLFSTLLLMAGGVGAQDLSDSLELVRHQVYGASWTATRNPVWLNEQSLPDFGEAGFHYEYAKGRFKRPQQALSERATGFGASGIKTYRSWRFQGAVSYRKIVDDSVKYSFAARPFDGNPFMVADLAGGNWKGDQLVSQFQFVTPSLGKWVLGLGVDYEAEQSARGNEPRPLYRLINYRINPAVSYQLSQHDRISFNAAFSKVNEVVEIGAYSRNNPLLYTLRGYGYATVSPVVTAERLRGGPGWEAGADYQYRQGGNAFFASAKFGLRREDVSDGYAGLLVGGLDEHRWSLIARFEQEGLNTGWSLGAHGWFRDGSGYDESQQAINPAYYLSGLNASLNWWKHRERGDLLILSVDPSVRYSNYFEQIAETDWTSIMAGATAGISYRYRISSRFSLTAEPRLGYYQNLSAELKINAPQLMSELLIRPDYQFLSSSYLEGGFCAHARFRSAERHYRISLAYITQSPAHQAKDYPFNRTNRNQFHATCTLIF